MADLESIGTLTRAQLEMLACVANGEELERPRTLDELPQLLGRYQIREPIGAGGMGFVFKGWDVRLQAHVAIKLARPAVSSDSNLQARLLREARSAAAIHHQCVVGIRDIGEAEDGSPFVVMDYLDGQPLSALLATRGPLPWAEAVGLLDQIASGLQAAHDSGIVHRDLKPSNVFVSEHAEASHCTLIDFGLARVLDVDEETRELTRDGQLVGTPRYMSPEQISGDGPVGPHSDVYALGCVAFHMLSGAPPFRGSLHQLLHKHLHEVPARLEGVPSPIADIVARCLAKKSSERPGSAALVRETLVLSQVKLEAAPRPRRRSPMLPLAAALSIGAMGGWLLHGTQSSAVVHQASAPVDIAATAAVDACPSEAVAARGGPPVDAAPVMPDAVAAPVLVEPSGAAQPPSEPVAIPTATEQEQPGLPKRVTPHPRRRPKPTAPTQPTVVPETVTTEAAPQPIPAEPRRTREEILEELDGLH